MVWKPHSVHQKTQSKCEREKPISIIKGKEVTAMEKIFLNEVKYNFMYNLKILNMQVVSWSLYTEGKERLKKGGKHSGLVGDNKAKEYTHEAWHRWLQDE